MRHKDCKKRRILGAPHPICSGFSVKASDEEDFKAVTTLAERLRTGKPRSKDCAFMFFYTMRDTQFWVSAKTEEIARGAIKEIKEELERLRREQPWYGSKAKK